MGRFSKNEELQKAFEDLNSSVDIATTDDDTMKDEYPVEEEMAEETSN
jgi:hypothetical protein